MVILLYIIFAHEISHVTMLNVQISNAYKSLNVYITQSVGVIDKVFNFSFLFGIYELLLWWKSSYFRIPLYKSFYDNYLIDSHFVM